jgi:hypothetical protein
MHKIEKGDIVFWYPDADPILENAVPAIVVQVEGKTVCLNLMETNRVQFTRKDGVRHISDPWYTDNPKHKGFYGGWDYSPLMKRVMTLEGLDSKPKGK